ncbi:MAG TPA: hypothetical protein DCZ94_15890 [Lentisphaeria bacterium]|nr:hypothetical protein [Lentisphaeria bacterium]
MKQANATSHPRASILTAARKRLQLETVRRKAAETSLMESRQHYGQLLVKSGLMKEQLRKLSLRILLARKEERKHISCELHDDITQILTGINGRSA